MLPPNSGCASLWLRASNFGSVRLGLALCLRSTPRSDGAVVGQVSVASNSLGAGADMQFFIHAPHVGIDCGHADVEALGDFFVKITLRKQIEHFLFARRKI